MRITISKGKNSSLLLTVLYKLLLDYTYITYQIKLFGYYGFIYSFDIERYCLGWLFTMIGIIIVCQKHDDIGDLLTYVVFVLSVVPFIVLYQYDYRVLAWMVSIQLFSLFLLAVFISFFRKLDDHIVFNKVSYKSRSLRKFVTLLLLAYLIISVLKNGIPSLQSIVFSNISMIRSEFSSSLIETIFRGLICKVVCPLFILIAIKEKKYIAAVFAIAIQVYMYAITGFKTYLFIPLVLIGVQQFKKLNLRKTISYGLPFAVLLTNILYKITDNNMIYALINERVIFLPAKIKYCYFDFFSNNPFIGFSQSSIAKIFGIQSNYSQNIPNMIGGLYFNKNGMWTNTGFIADAYANLGVWGVIIISLFMAIVIGFAIRQLNFVSGAMQKSIQALFLVFYISLNDGGAISVVVSGGMIFAILVVSLIDFSDMEEIDDGKIQEF